MSVNLNNQNNILSQMNSLENINQRQSFQDGTEDEIVSFQEDMNEGTSNMLMKNKELPYLENDKSITVDNDYDEDNTLNGKRYAMNSSVGMNKSNLSNTDLINDLTNNKNTLTPNIKRTTNNDLMKYISDSNEFFERPFMNRTGQGNLITFSNLNKKDMDELQEEEEPIRQLATIQNDSNYKQNYLGTLNNFDKFQRIHSRLEKGIKNEMDNNILNINNKIQNQPSERNINSSNSGINNILSYNISNSNIDNSNTNNLGEYINPNINLQKNNPMFINDGLDIIEPLDTKIINTNTEDNNFPKRSFIPNKRYISYEIENFNFFYFGIPSGTNSLMSTQSFGPRQKLKEKEYLELEQNYNQVLDLLKYWQQFYLDIVKLVSKNKLIKPEGGDESDFFSEDYRYSVIEEVKQLIEMARNKVYNCFEIENKINLSFIGESLDNLSKEMKSMQTSMQFPLMEYHFKELNIENNISDLEFKATIIKEYLDTEKEIERNSFELEIKNEKLKKFFDYLEIINENSLFFEKKIGIKIPKILDYNDYYDALPPLQYSERQKILQTKEYRISPTNNKDKTENNYNPINTNENKTELIDEETQTESLKIEEIEAQTSFIINEGINTINNNMFNNGLNNTNDIVNNTLSNNSNIINNITSQENTSRNHQNNFNREYSELSENDINNQLATDTNINNKPIINLKNNQKEFNTINTSNLNTFISPVGSVPITPQNTQPSPITYPKKSKSKGKTINNKFTKEKCLVDIYGKIFINFPAKNPRKKSNSPNTKGNKKSLSHSGSNASILHSTESQTDFTLKNIVNLEMLNKEYSIQLKRTEKEKENLKKKYDSEIKDLNKQLSESKEKEIQKLNENKLNEDPIENETKIPSNEINKEQSSLNFFPELIPPEQTYKIFMHSVKHFKYEEDIYKKLIEEEDLKILKHFVNKMEKYLIGTSIPCQRTAKTNKFINNVNNIPIPNSSKKNFYATNIKTNSLKKYHENILNGIRPLPTNSQYYKGTGGNNLFSEKRNNSSFMKYKNAIKNIHDNS
ncbi:MAG: hypothetical protein MJ252_09315 [archaeon]|nr:hypothetical protein [archaeon]